MSGRLLMLRIAGALLFLSLVVATLPRLIAIIDNARTLMPLPYEARRERQIGPLYASVEKLRRELAEKEPVALVASPHDIDAAVFANYYLYPIRTRLFAGRNLYVNATPDPTRPKTIVAVTGARVERTTYEVLRDRDLRAGYRVVASPKLSEPASTFIVPLAASLDGPTPETFVIEATLANPNFTAAEVRVTFWPKGIVRTLTIAPGATIAYYDFLYQLFAVTDRGWMRIESSQSLRSAFYFANRGRGDAAELPNAIKPATAITPAPLYRNTKLFIVNPNDTPTNVVIDGESIPLDPHAFISRPIAALPVISGNVYAFATTRELNGRTDFLWPQ